MTMTVGVFKNYYMDRLKTFRELKAEPFEPLENAIVEADDTLVIQDIKRKLTPYLLKLRAREERVIRERFFNGKTLEEVGCAQSVTRDRIRQIEAKALRNLRVAMRFDNEIKNLIGIAF